MALPRSLPRLARLALSAGARARSDAPPRDSCSPTPAPPCPPCEPHARPPCRGRAAERVRALRVTCCPPPRGARPPCAPPLPACALDCTQAKPRKDCRTQTNAVLDEDCGIEQDVVASRLNASRSARRRDYMREVAERRPPCAPRVEPYQLAGERECVRATDGREYAIAPSAPATPSAPGATMSRACGPCREPPPPKCVELVPDNECKVRGPNYTDPCAHHPRVIVNIDRSKTRETSSDIKNCTARRSAAGIATRIMKTLNLSRGEGGESSGKCAPQPSSGAGGADGAGGTGGAGGKAKYAGDTGWCGNIQIPNTTTRCRPLSQTERLRRRACRDIRCGPEQPKTRGLHTAGPTCTKAAPKDMKTMAAQTKENVEKLEKMLNKRASFKEAAKGRVIDCVPKVSVPASGKLELPVPPGAAAVRVKVSLDPARNPCAPSPRTAPPAPCTAGAGSEQVSPCAARAAAVSCSAPAAAPPDKNTPVCVSRAVPPDEKSESWLSIKTLQKKIAETCRITETSSKDNSKDPCKEPSRSKPPPCAPAPKPSSPCAPTRPSPCAPPRPSPCAPPKAPSKNTDCDKKKKKPTCFTPEFSTPIAVFK